MGTNRITTREAAKLLGCHLSQTRALLQAAQITPVRCGGAYLWDAERVNRVLAAIRAEASK